MMKRNIGSRRNQIVSLLQEQKNINVSGLSKALGVTKETIRKDLDYLERKGVLNRTHGGAVLCRNPGEIPFEFRAMDHSEMKRAMASCAIDFIEDQTMVYISASSSVVAMSRYLPIRKKMIVYTNSVQLLSHKMEDTHKYYLLGGQFNKDGQRIIGPDVIKALDDLYFDTCIFSMDGICPDGALASNSYDEYLIAKKVIEHSKRCILIADGSKFERSANYRFAQDNQIDVLVTTKPIEGYAFKKVIVIS
ncbi:MAG: DeoR/GlpR transcriptional regulator [Erysipelotrichaceae bacterium]|nr:DeoR/GlpR transcriptional regulator [Erysipelotrichaceae bacterium]